MASPSNTLRRYFATKTKWTCILKTQCRPCLISLSSLIGQIIISACNASKPSNTNCDQTASKSGKCAASPVRAGSSTTRGWRCRKSATSAERRSWATPGCARCSPSGATARKRLGMADAPAHPLQQALKDLERAYSNFFAKRADFPRFKKKGQGDSFRYPDPKQIKLDQGNSRIFLPKLGWLRYR